MGILLAAFLAANQGIDVMIEGFPIYGADGETFTLVYPSRDGKIVPWGEQSICVSLTFGGYVEVACPSEDALRRADLITLAPHGALINPEH